ncbi:outer membrane porin, OprD family [Pseudomonas sp. H9]|nr:OprD family outer membrane porin [Pseudomonas sp. H9]TDF83837.1 outer membrane porin, OprD family [Pseudomonas sp. H9]
MGEWSLLSRNFLLDSDFRNKEPGAPGRRREWAQGFIGALSSAYTPGIVGIGVDLHGFVGIKLDGGRGHAGVGLLPVDSDGRAASEYSDAGGALKLKAGNTVLSYGEMLVETPVFDTGDKRLQPEYATGWFLDSTLSSVWKLQAGRFTAFKNQAGSSSYEDFEGYGATTKNNAISLVGSLYKVRREDYSWGASVFGGQLEDVWQQRYLNLNASTGALSVDGNLYKVRDQGLAKAGKIDTLAYSILTSIAMTSHTLSLGYQKVEGSTPFDFVGGDSIYLANSIKFADFNGPGEQSWQGRYQWNAATAGVPGLTFSLRYVTGRSIDGTHAPRGGAYNPFDPDAGAFVPAQGKGGKHWERDMDLRYVVQGGPAKDLSIALAHVSHRANDAQAGPDLDRIYVVIEFPLK